MLVIIRLKAISVQSIKIGLTWVEICKNMQNMREVSFVAKIAILSYKSYCETSYIV